MTSRATRYLAAHLIAAPGFPGRGDVPKPVPPPFCNFGHQVLTDLPRLLRIVWQVAVDAREAVRRSGYRPYWSAVLTIAATAAWIMGVLAGLPPLETGAALAALVAALRAAMRRGALRAMARVRAEAVQALLEDRFRETESPVQVDSSAVGDGRLDGPRVPVLAAVSRRPPFPGFGQLQIDTTFTCSPKDDGEPQGWIDLANAVRARVGVAITEQPDVIATEGDVVVVHGDSLSTSSNWLGAAKAPVLWLERGDLDRVHEIDRDAAVRVFRAAQIVIPRYATAATFFFRLFPAGTGIAFHIAMTTLGPPVSSLDRLVTRLFRHRIDESDRSRPWWRRWFARRPTSARAGAARDGLEGLDKVDLANVLDDEFQRDVDLDSIAALDLADETRRGDGYAARFAEVVQRSALWPGRLLAENLREDNSLTFPADFFGRPESIALIHTVYEQIVKCVLEAFDAHGYDISEYRDDKGRFQIKADKIDQLVVGEKITMSKDDTASKRANEPAKPSAAAA